MGGLVFISDPVLKYCSPDLWMQVNSYEPMIYSCSPGAIYPYLQWVRHRTESYGSATKFWICNLVWKESQNFRDPNNTFASFEKRIPRAVDAFENLPTLEREGIPRVNEESVFSLYTRFSWHGWRSRHSIAADWFLQASSGLMCLTLLRDYFSEFYSNFLTRRPRLEAGMTYFISTQYV